MCLTDLETFFTLQVRLISGADVTIFRCCCALKPLPSRCRRTGRQRNAACLERVFRVLVSTPVCLPQDWTSSDHLTQSRESLAPAPPTKTRPPNPQGRSPLGHRSWEHSPWARNPWEANQWEPSLWEPSLWVPSLWVPSQWELTLWEPSLWEHSQWEHKMQWVQCKIIIIRNLVDKTF